MKNLGNSIAGWSNWAILSVLIALVGLGCPHCLATSLQPLVSHGAGLEIAATGQAAAPAEMPSCHGPALAQTKQSEAQSEAFASVDFGDERMPVMACDCAGCGEADLAVRPAEPEYRRLAYVAVPVMSAPRPLQANPVTRLSSRHPPWVPPPYPGFFENTVVLLN